MKVGVVTGRRLVLDGSWVEVDEGSQSQVDQRPGKKGIFKRPEALMLFVVGPLYK